MANPELIALRAQGEALILDLEAIECERRRLRKLLGLRIIGGHILPSGILSTIIAASLALGLLKEWPPQI